MGFEKLASSAEFVEKSLPRFIIDLQQQLSHCENNDQLLTALASGFRELLPVTDRVSIVFLEPDKEWMRIYRVLPSQSNSLEPLSRVRVEGTPVGRVVSEGVGSVVADVRADPNITFGHASHDRIRSTLSVPIRVGGSVMGAINAGSATAGTCTQAMLTQLEEVVAVVGPTIYASEQVFARREHDISIRERSVRADEIAGDVPAGLVGYSDAFKSLLAAAHRAAQSDADILITGETGVGKTALARAMHAWSNRASECFSTVHIADLSSTIVESELFGHVRGAFTGALADRVGRFEAAHGGTIFLDEIGETQPPIQCKLLRVIQERCFERVGGSRTIEADVRVIAATSRDLHELMLRGEFREDLFYRLNVVPLHVPSLRDRSDDLKPLVESILARIKDGGGRQLSGDAWRRVRAYRWPGNIRELESVLRRAVILEDGEELQLHGFAEGTSSAASPGATPTMDSEWTTLDEHQRRYIEQVLHSCEGVIEGAGGAAQRLGMRPSTLRSRMDRLGVAGRHTRGKGMR